MVRIQWKLFYLCFRRGMNNCKRDAEDDAVVIMSTVQLGSKVTSMHAMWNSFAVLAGKVQR